MTTQKTVFFTVTIVRILPVILYGCQYLSPCERRTDKGLRGKGPDETILIWERERKEQGNRANFIITSFKICTPHQILLGRF